MNGNSHTQVITKSKMQIFLAFILITFTINLSYANDLLQDYIAIDAFRIENQIKSKINSALSVYLKENEYVVNTSIKTKIVSPAAKTASENKKQAISDDNINSRPDFMLYHRLGLDEVLQNPISQEESLKQQQAKEVIDTIDIELFHDELWSEDKTKQISSLLDKLVFNLQVKPKIKMVPVNMTLPVVATEEVVAEEIVEEMPVDLSSLSLLELINLASKFSTSLGLLFAATLLGFIGFVLTKIFMNQQKNQAEALIKANKEIAEAARSASESSSVAETETPSSSAEQALTSGVSSDDIAEEGRIAAKRFLSFYQQNPTEGILFARKWLQMGVDSADNALRIIAEELESQTLFKILESLEPYERLRWKSILASTDTSGAKEGIQFLNRQIIEEIIAPTDLLSEETKSILISVKPEKCAKIITENVHLAPLLMNSLSSGFLAQMMSFLEDDIIDSITEASISSDNAQLKDLDKELLEKLRTIRSVKSGTNFGSKIPEIIPSMPPEKQKFLFAALGKEGDAEKLRSILFKYFPLEGVEMLTEDTLKNILSKIPQAKLIDYLLTLESEQSDRYLEIIAPAGSNKRNVLDLEIENISTNEIKMAQIKKSSNEIESYFINFVRKIINSNIAIREKVSPAIEQLCHKYSAQDESTGESRAA